MHITIELPDRLGRRLQILADEYAKSEWGHSITNRDDPIPEFLAVICYHIDKGLRLDGDHSSDWLARVAGGDEVIEATRERMLAHGVLCFPD